MPLVQKDLTKQILFTAAQIRHYAFYENRLLSFSSATQTTKGKKQTLATDGFFYTGYMDQVCCYKCNVRIQKWKEKDKPHVVHKKYAPHCLMVINRTQFEHSTLLVHNLRVRKAMLHNSITFQAVARLQHYIRRPITTRLDWEIDVESIETWKELPDEKNPYTQIIKLAHEANTNKDDDIVSLVYLSHTPLQWFIKIEQTRVWVRHNSLEKSMPITKLSAQWKDMPKEARYPFMRLSCLDKSRNKTKLIEDVMDYNNIDIGLQKNSKNNVIVQIKDANEPLIKISTLLSDRMSNLIFETCKTVDNN